MRLLTTLAIAVIACGNNAKPPTMPDAAAAVDAAPDAPDPRGPATIPLTGGANAVLWDAATSTLYLTDNNTNSLLRWTDAKGIETVAAWPATAMVSLGDLVKRSDGTILTANFGFGTAGTLFAMPPSGPAVALTGLAPANRRVGLAQDSAGALYEAYFVGGGGGMQTGGVASVTIAGTTATETEIAGTVNAAGFKKVVGLVATPTAVYVTDQTQKMIFKIAIPGNTVTPLATVASADLLVAMPNGDLLTGGGTTVQRITPAGVVTNLSLAGFEQIRGMAFDPAKKRLFLINHSATVGTPDKLEIRPLDD